MNRTSSRAIIALIVVFSLPLRTVPAFATGFTITSPSTTPQTLGSGSGQTGTITSTGTLTTGQGQTAVTISGATATLTNSGVITQSGTTSGAGSIAVVVSGNGATIINLGTIKQTGADRVIRDNTGVSGLNITNGSVTNSTALMQSADNDVIQMNKAAGQVVLNNYGTMTSQNASGGGAQAVDFSAIGATGSNTTNNFSTGVMQATEADAVRPGVNGVVYNAGLMKSTTTTGSSSDGIDGQNNTGIQITNDGTGTVDGARHGITGGQSTAATVYTMTITNNAGGVIKGENGSGVNIDGFNAKQTLTVANAGTITGNGVTGDGDGIDSDGLLTLHNSGLIQSLNAFSGVPGAPAQSEGLTIGGGMVFNSGTIQGLVAAGNTNAVGRGITLAGNDITTGPLTGTREAIYGNATITNLSGGRIIGQSDSAIVVDGPASGFTVVVNDNVGGAIIGGGTAAAAILTGADNDTINEAGLIDGSSSGKAISMGAGNNLLDITGGAASILGSIDGGIGGVNTMMLDMGLGNTFSYLGSISHFSTLDVHSGEFKLGGSNEIYDLTSLDFTGGTFDLNNFSEGSAGANGLGALNLLSTSTIDFGTLGGGSNLIAFSGIGAHTAGSLLQLSDYNFGLDHLLFGGSDTAFTSLFGANDVCFDSGCGYSVFQFENYFEVTPSVPEPMTLSLLGLGLGGLAVTRRRRPR